LNDILGTEASVRVLRVICLSDIPIGVSEVARRARLQPSGVARVCAKLEDLGVLEAVGRGVRNRQYRRFSRFSLSGTLTELFAHERNRVESIFRGIEAAVHGSAIRAAWIEGPVATETDRPDDILLVGVLTDPPYVEDIRLAVWQRLLQIQSNHDVTIELQVTTLADLATADAARRESLETARPVLGAPPLDILAGEAEGKKPAATHGPARSHRQLDARAQALAAQIADHLKRDPSLIEDTRRYIERRLPGASPGERLELEEWRGILDTMSPAKLRRFLVRDDARAVRLRQSLPFVHALSPEARRALSDELGRDG
jgi:DNA-binding Lrp family transcriptional regulator